MYYYPKMCVTVSLEQRKPDSEDQPSSERRTGEMEDRRKKDDCTTTSCLFPFVIQPNVIVCVQLYCDAAALCIVYLLSHQTK